MRLQKCFIENFGTLHHYLLYFESGLTLVNENNGFGKSTLVAFIKAMFYGFPKASKTLEKNERKKYMPWQGGVYGGYLDFSLDQKEYRIERTFGLTPKEDHFKLFRLNPVSISYDFSENIGYELFKVNAESFEKTILMQQFRHYDGFSTTEINSMLVKMIKEITDLENYHNTIKILKTNRGKIISSKGNEGSLKKINEDISKAELQQHRIKKQQEELKKLQTELTKINETIRFFEKTNMASNSSDHLATANQQALLVELSEINSQLSNQQNIVNELNMKLASIKKPKLLPSMISLLLSGILLLFVMFDNSFLNDSIIYFLNLCSNLMIVITALYWIVAIVRYKWKRKKVMRKITLEERYIGDLQSKKSAFMHQIHFQQKQKNINIYSNLQNSDNEIYESLTQKRITLYEEIAVLKHSLETLADHKYKLQELINERNQQLEKLKQLDKAIEHLTHAYESISAGHINTFKASFDFYAKQIMNIPSSDIHFDKEINPYIEIFGIQREFPYFSSAEQTMIALCIRLAFIDILYPNESIFLIMDDPFCGFDENNLSKVMKFLDRYTEKHQLLYLTCHGSRI